MAEVWNGGLEPQDYTPNTIEEMGGMIGKVAFQVIRNANAVNPLYVFEKARVENGDTIEQVVIKMATARDYDSTGANALTRKQVEMAVRYFKDWKREVFDTSVDIPEIRKVLLGSMGASDVASKIVASLGEGETDNVFSKTKALLKWGRQSADGGTGAVLKNYGTIALKDGAIDYEEFLIAVKDTVKGMQFANADFNTAELKRRTLNEDIYIVMPYKLKNRIDVSDLANAYNLDKKEIANKIIEVDTGTESRYQYVYIVDKNAILDFLRLYEMADQKNADGLFWNYFLHTERLYGISPLFDCGYLKVEVEPEGE